MSVRARRPPRRATIHQRRARLAGLILLVVIVTIVLCDLGGSLPAPPRGGAALGAAAGDPFGYRASRESDFVARATAGEAHVLFVQSPGGAMATAARVAAYRPLIDRVTAGTNIDPNLLEALVFVESAGRPQVIAGSDPANAAGLTQILAATGQSLLGMNIDLARSRRLTRQIDAVAAGARRGLLAPLLAQRTAADPRFNPSTELAATVRYLQDSERQFGREDLAIESYHMGIGNLHQVLSDYNGGTPVPYAQLYFDTAPDLHRQAYNLLAGFGDDSSLYLWRVLGAAQIMRLYRTDRTALRHLSALQTSAASNALVLEPPGSSPRFADAPALSAAYQDHSLVPLPSNATQLGLIYDPAMGAGAAKLGVPRGLYRGLRPVALRMLIALAARVRALSGGAAPIEVRTAVADRQYIHETGTGFASSADGYSFQIARRYVSTTQANAFQAVLDRLQALNLIAWSRDPSSIDITVARDAGLWTR
ncbi:MAG: transglycosylase SLT domain-containing protein [Solirubrobacteraceae bacterium]